MRRAKLIPLYAAICVFLVHLAANPHYGFFRDELYFIVCGFRPAWGYVDQPPLVPLLAAGSQLFGRSLFLIRAVAAVVAFFTPVLMNFGMKVSTDSPGLLLWPLAALCVLRVVKGRDPRWWVVAGAALGLAFQSKYSVLFFAAALLLGLLATPERRALRSWWFLAGLALAIAIALPNILWQLHFNLPMLELLKNGQHGKNVELNPAEFIFAEVLITNPVLALVWLSGLVWLLRNRSVRFLAFTFLALMLEMIALHAKHYYPANVYPILIAAGGVAIEQWTEKLKSLRPAIGMLAVASGLVLVPYVLPVLPIQTFIPYHQTIAPLLHLEKA